MAGIATSISADPFGTSAKSPTVSKYMQDSQSHFDGMPTPQPAQSQLSSTGGLAQPAPTLGQAQAPDTNSAPAQKNLANQQQSIEGTHIRPANADELGLNGDPIADVGRAQNDISNTQAAQAYKARQASLNGLGVSDTGGGLLDGLDQEQSNNVAAIVKAGKARGLGDQEIQIGIMTALAESGLKNLNYGDRDSLGLFQQRPSQGWGSPSQVTDPTYAANKFYDGLTGTQGDPWARAQAVQRSAFADGSNYKAQWDKAQAIYANYSAGARSAPTTGANGSAQWITANTGRYLDYDGVYGAQCVDLYDFYTTGFVGGKAPMVGYAQEIWNNYDASAYTRVNAANGTQMGDVAVWGAGGSTPMSHVGIIIQDLGNGFVKTLSNNATSAGQNGSSAVVTISKANLLGYLRPNKLR